MSASGSGSKHASTSASQSAHRKPAKRVKPELPVGEKVQKLWRSAKDQIQDGYPEHALKTVQKIRSLDPNNRLARQTHLQLLLSLDKYADALAYATAEEQVGAFKIEECYALYKLGRMAEAEQVLDNLREAIADDDDSARTVDVLDAQIKYRLERFEDSQALYEDLLASVEEGSPENDDLQTNLGACGAHLDFISSIPSLLGDLTSSGKLPSIESLENNPVAPLIAAHPAYKQRSQPIPPTSSAAGSAEASTKAAKKGKKAILPAKKTKASKLPPKIAALPEDQRPAPDPERWLPKRERKGYAEVLAAKEKEKEKRRLKNRKKQEATLTQGAEESNTSTAAKQQSQTGNKGGQQQSKKSNKKKGKK